MTLRFYPFYLVCVGNSNGQPSYKGFSIGPMIADRRHDDSLRESEDAHFQATLNVVSRSRSMPVDLIAAALVPFLTIWLYEIANWVVLAVQGARVSLSTVGWLPLGVAGVTSGGLSPLTKVFQIALAVGLLLPLWKLFSKARLWIADAFIISSVGIFLASAYWEMLSILTVLPMAIHTGIFIVGASATVFVLLHSSQVGRPRHVRNASTPRDLTR
jgi:hypothetical protein